ncbi:MAG: histidine phosphatase family protein [Ornithinimicrobium sp.]
MTEMTLVLLRHAKTEQAGPPTQGDHGRRLLERGTADARAAGRVLIDYDLVPDLVLCSTSVRTVQTWEAMVDGAAEAASDDGDRGPLADVEVWHDRRIYNASPGELLDVLGGVPDDARVVAMVGHAPGIPALAVGLIDPDEPASAASQELSAGFPTMALAVLDGVSEDPAPSAGSMSLRLVHTCRR